MGDVTVELLQQHLIHGNSLHKFKKAACIHKLVLYDKGFVRMCVYGYKWSVWFCTCLCLCVCLHDVTQFVLWVLVMVLCDIKQ